MKKLINIGLIALTFAFIGTVDAKIMKRRTGTTIPVTKNEKQIFVDTKDLKNAPTAEEKIAAAQKLAADLKKDPYSRLKIKKDTIEEMIKEKEEEIWNLDDKELVQEAILDKENLEKQLAEIQEKLGIYNNIQPEKVSKLKTWALYTLIGTVGLAIADQLITGGIGRTALMSGIGTAGSAIGSAASTVWKNAPSASGTWETTKTALGYGASALTISYYLSQAQSIKNGIMAAIYNEESQPNPDLQRIAQLQQQLAEQDERIAELESKIQK